ncbi:MAG: helix-turn-helix domain-containing protein [Cyanobacteria bacterium J06598_3]
MTARFVPSPQALAIYMRDQRKAAQLSQSAVSDRVGIRQETVSAFENKPESTKLETLFKLLSALNLEIQIAEKGAPPSPEWDEEW